MPDAPESLAADEAYAACRALLDGYPIIVEQAVAWGDMDALGHVNNSVYFRYFESARMAYFERVGFTAGSATPGIGPILAETSCRFRAALVYPDFIAVGTRVANIEPDRIHMEYAIAGSRAARLVASGTGLVVAYDYTAGRKAVLPQTVATNIRRLEGLV